MTFGTHCPNCGRESCGWSHGRRCEGLVHPTTVAIRDAHDRMPWWRRIFSRRPPIRETVIARETEFLRSGCKFPAWPGYICRCHARMGNDFWFLPAGSCLFQ